jgi:predicted kinase
MNTPRGECKFRNNNRERKVPNEAINRQDWQMERDAGTIPDQFDEIVIVEGWKK